MSFIPPEQALSPRSRLQLLQVEKNTGEGGYSIAQIKWDGHPAMGLRWNGTKSNPAGFPSMYGKHAQWIVLPADQFKTKKDAGAFFEALIKTLGAIRPEININVSAIQVNL